jgi:hypothetical protein
MKSFFMATRVYAPWIALEGKQGLMATQSEAEMETFRQKLEDAESHPAKKSPASSYQKRLDSLRGNIASFSPILLRSRRSLPVPEIVGMTKRGDQNSDYDVNVHI